MVAPLNYTVLLHSVLFGGDAGAASEPVSIMAEFLDLPGRPGLR